MPDHAFKLITAGEARASTRADLHLQASDDSDQRTLIAQAVKRVCGILCPCTARAIADAAFASLHLVVDDDGELRDVIRSSLEALSISGDVIEMGASFSEDEMPQQLFHCAPPSYMLMGSKIYLTGVAPDDAPVLPTGIASLVIAKGAIRYINAVDPDQLCEQLQGLGLRAMTPEDWFRRSSHGKAATFLAKMRQRLAEFGVDGDLQGVRVLAPNGDGNAAYKSRWVEPSRRAGLHIIRTPRTFGADAWLLAMLRDGRVERSYALYGLDNTTTRACDVGWLTQLALDATSGNPNTYHFQRDRDDLLVTLDFPLPTHAKRRLLYWSGGMVVDSNNYRTFHLPSNASAAVERFLQEQCWMQLSHD